MYMKEHLSKYYSVLQWVNITDRTERVMREGWREMNEGSLFRQIRDPEASKIKRSLKRGHQSVGHPSVVLIRTETGRRGKDARLVCVQAKQESEQTFEGNQHCNFCSPPSQKKKESLQSNVRRGRYHCTPLAGGDRKENKQGDTLFPPRVQGCLHWLLVCTHFTHAVIKCSTV